MDSKRFRVALSFPGEHRDYVERVAVALGEKLQRDQVFYDRWFEAELARPNLDTYLTAIYHSQSELLVVFLCEAYDRKEWCGLEWRAVRDLIKRRVDSKIMLVRLDDSEIPGTLSIDGYISAVNRPPQELASLILSRVGSSVQQPTGGVADRGSSGVIVDSGPWCILNGHYFHAESFRTNDKAVLRCDCDQRH
jgi:hypothetical protein